MDIFLVVLAIAVIWLLVRSFTGAPGSGHTSTDRAPRPDAKPAAVFSADDEKLRDAMRIAKNALFEQIGTSASKSIALKDLNRIAADIEQKAGQELAARCVRVLALQLAVKQGVVPAQDALRIVSDAEADRTGGAPTAQLYEGARRALEATAAQRPGGTSGAE